MNPESKGGASRPRRRRVCQLGVLFVLAAILLVSIKDSSAGVFSTVFEEAPKQLEDPDSIYARHLIDAVRGANGVLCRAVDRSFDTGYWSHSLTTVIETDFADQRSADIARWVGRRRFDESVLQVARAAMASSDACVRRMGARMAGNVEGAEQLHERLRSELTSSSATTRTAALFALGFADQREAVPTIRERLSDSDRNVRVAAIWALGSIGDPTIGETLIGLLERDGDPVVRGAAAWALGRIHD